MNKCERTVILCVSLQMALATYGTANDSVTTAPAQAQEPALTTEQNITNGFLFIDGKYIDSPYVVTHRGMAIFVNDFMIDGHRKLKSGPYPSDIIDPEIPPQITRETSLYDPRIKEYLLEKKTYVQKHCTPEEEAREMEQFYRTLPCTKEARINERFSDILEVTTFNGERHNVLLSPPRRATKKDRDSEMKRLEVLKNHYESRFQKGDCFFFSSTGGRFSFSEGKAAEILPKVIPILRSDKDNDTKFTEIQNAGLPMVTQDSFSSIVTNFHASAQLDERIKALVDESATKREQNSKDAQPDK